MKIQLLTLFSILLISNCCPGHGDHGHPHIGAPNNDEIYIIDLQKNYQESESSVQATNNVHADPIYSMTILNSEPGQTAHGRVEMVQVNGITHIKATVQDLAPGSHGLHIHEFGNLIQGCTSAGPHYNPFNHDHAGPNDEIRHVGDCGNIVMVANATEATLVLTSNLIQLSGDTSVIGRSYVLHADEDDLGRGSFPDSKTTGHAGARIACGVIGLSAPFDHWF